MTHPAPQLLLDQSFPVSVRGGGLQLTGTRGLVEEGGVKGVVNAFRG